MIEPSKETTNYVVSAISSFMRSVLPFSNDTLGGIAVIIHILFGITIIYALIGKKVNNTYYIYIFIWFLVIYSNYFFHGCILSRVERDLFKNRNWCGPVSLLNFFIEMVGITVTKDVANGIIKYFIAAPVCTIVIFKVLFSFDLFMTVVLSVLWIPLLFIHSQKPIFESIKQPPKDLSGKIIAVTGCSSGIGKELVKSLVEKDGTVILLNRKSDHATKFYEDIKSDKVVNIECDLTSFKSVEAAAKEIRNKFPKGIDILYTNAGISNQPSSITEDGYEIHIQTNYLSHVLLINRISDLIKDRIINTSSIAYKIPYKFYSEDLLSKNNTDSGISLYQQSKLGMLLYLQNLKQKVKIVNVQPGICSTELLDNTILPYPLSLVLKLFGSSSKTGSEYLLKAITSDSKNEFIGPNVFFMNMNNIDTYLVNETHSREIYETTHRHLGLDL